MILSRFSLPTMFQVSLGQHRALMGGWEWGGRGEEGCYLLSLPVCPMAILAETLNSQTSDLATWPLLQDLSSLLGSAAQTLKRPLSSFSFWVVLAPKL